MQCRVLGPVEATIGGRPVELGGRKQRTLFALLVAAGGRVVSVERLVDELWGTEPPPKVLVSLQSYVANLRRALEPERASRAPSRLLVTRPPGYALTVAPGGLDAAAFERLAGSAHELVGTDPARARERYADAAALWHGDAYADVASAAPGLAAEALRLQELRLAAIEDCWRAELALGGHERVVGEIESLLAAHPLREATWGLLVTALYRAQRQGDALDALRRARAVLATELGVDPGPELRALEQAVLRHEPSLAAPARTPSAPERVAPLVGRADVLAGLTGCLVDAAAGRGRLALVTGEPGIGKTAVAEALRATAAAMGLRTGWGRCEEAAGAPPMWPWSQALRGVLGDAGTELLERLLGERAPDVAAVLPTRGHPGHAPAADVHTADVHTVDVHTASFRLAEAVVVLLRAAGPALLVLDDLHWADADTVALLRRLGPALAGLPVTVVATVRSSEADIGAPLADALGDLARAAPHRVGLTGLRPADVAAYLHRSHGVAVAADVAAQLCDRTDGNPFYLGELARLLVAEERLAEPGVIASLDVPDGVRDVVRRRLAALPSPARTLLEAAAVAGRSFDLDAASAAAGLDADAGATGVEAATAAGLVAEERPGRYRFAHALVREAVYARLPAPLRTRLHARLAAVLEQLWSGAIEDRLAELAGHHAGAGQLRQARTYATAAAVRAGAQPAPAEAVRLYELAGATLADDPTATPADRYAVLRDLAVARQRAGQVAAARAAAREAAAVALRGGPRSAPAAIGGVVRAANGDVVRAAEAAVAVTIDAVWGSREYSVVDTEAVELLERLLGWLPAGHDVLRARLLAALAAESYYAPGTAGRALALSDEAVVLARAAGSSAVLAQVLELRHVALERPALLGERSAAAEELVALAEAAGDPVARAKALTFRGRDRIESGEVRAGRSDHARALELAEAHAVVPALVALGWADAVMLLAAGRFDDAERAVERAGTWHAGTTIPGTAIIPVGVAATRELVRGTPEGSEQLLADTVASVPLALLLDWHALAVLRAGRRDEARHMAERHTADPPPDYLWLTHMTIRAHLWAELGLPDVARLRAQLTPFAGRVAIAGTGVAYAGVVGHAVGRLSRACGDLDDAVSQLQAARLLAEHGGLAPEAAAIASLMRSPHPPGG